MDLFKQLFEQIVSIEEEFLYHATYRPLLPKIKKRGLGASSKKNWEDSEKGVVYLESSSEAALAFAECSENAPEEWLDVIVILRVRKDRLDMDKLFPDKNVRPTEGELVTSFEYHGIIPFEWLDIVG